nr:MAG TPA: hypothetical protein [Caudoviricetes sp.]
MFVCEQNCSYLCSVVQAELQRNLQNWSKI